MSAGILVHIKVDRTEVVRWIGTVIGGFVLTAFGSTLTVCVGGWASENNCKINVDTTHKAIINVHVTQVITHSIPCIRAVASTLLVAAGDAFRFSLGGSASVSYTEGISNHALSFADIIINQFIIAYLGYSLVCTVLLLETRVLGAGVCGAGPD